MIDAGCRNETEQYEDESQDSQQQGKFPTRTGGGRGRHPGRRTRLTDSVREMIGHLNPVRIALFTYHTLMQMGMKEPLPPEGHGPVGQQQQVLIALLAPHLVSKSFSDAPFSELPISVCAL